MLPRAGSDPGTSMATHLSMASCTQPSLTIFHPGAGGLLPLGSPLHLVRRSPEHPSRLLTRWLSCLLNTKLQQHLASGPQERFAHNEGRWQTVRVSSLRYRHLSQLPERDCGIFWAVGHTRELESWSRFLGIASGCWVFSIPPAGAGMVGVCCCRQFADYLCSWTLRMVSE